MSNVIQKNYDVVHINPSFDFKSLVRDGLILFFLRLMGYHKVLFYIHGWRQKDYRIVRDSPLLSGLFRWLLNGTGRILVLAPEFKTFLEDLGVKSNKIIFTRTMFDGAELMKGTGNLSPPNGRRVILFMSRFIRTKGIYELLNAFARLSSEFSDVDLVMAGDGEENDRARTYAARLNIKDRVSFPGYLRGEEKNQMLRQCSICALPTYYPEGMPVMLLEAMGSGKPLLTAKVGGIRYVIKDPENGVVLDEVTSDTVVDGLRRLLLDPQKTAEIGRNNQVYAWKNFEAKVVTAEIEQIYNEIAITC